MNTKHKDPAHIDNIKLDSLEKSHNILNVLNHYLNYQNKQISNGINIIYLLGLLVSEIFLVGLLIFAIINNGFKADIIPLLIGVIAIGVQIFNILYKGIYLRSLRQLKLIDFAKDNGYELWLNSSHKISSNSGILFKNKESVALEALVINDNLELGNIIMTSNERSDKSTEYFYACLGVDKNLGQIIIDAKSNNFLGGDSNFIQFDSFDQNLDLEGDFSNHFQLYVPKDTKRDALYIFTPDLMALLVDKFNDFDIEVIGKKIYFYKKGVLNISDANQLMEILDSLQDLNMAISKRVKRFKADISHKSNIGLKKSNRFLVYSVLLVIAALSVAFLSDWVEKNSINASKYALYVLLILMIIASYAIRFIRK